MKLLGFDPGNAIGYGLMESMKMLHHGIASMAMLRDLIREADVVIAEDFVLFAHKSDALRWNKFVPARVLGMIELICWEENKPLHLQKSAERTFFGGERTEKVSSVGNQRLRALGFWYSTPHERDAARHILTYYRKTKDADLHEALRKMR